MAYFAPYVDASGFHYPTYNELLEQLVDDMQTIYGPGIYLGNDSQDYQMLSQIANKIHDAYQAFDLAFTSRSPATAMGTGLDQIVAVNGLVRKEATKSTVTLRVTGTAGTVIDSGTAADEKGNLWDLPAQVTIGSGGTVDCTATARETGEVYADIGTIIRIMTPIAGWTAVTNIDQAVLGSVAESDESLRARQAKAAALPSRSILEGMLTALSSLDEVMRCRVYENDSGSTDANGIPAHSVWCVIDGGNAQEIAETIFRYKAPGCGTHGDESVTITDEDAQNHIIKYSNVTTVELDIVITIAARSGYSSTSADAIKEAVSEYLSGFGIGDSLSLSMLWMVILAVNEDIHQPTFTLTSVQAARHGSTPSSSDITVDPDEAVHASVANITVTVT